MSGEIGDPTIETFDVSYYAGLGVYAHHSIELACMYAGLAADATNEHERSEYLRNEEMHRCLAHKYQTADAIMAEVLIAEEPAK